MSYCVNCGVELDAGAHSCPLCGTPVINPRCPVDENATPPFPLVRREVEPVDRRSVGWLLTVMLASAAVCCGLINGLAFFPSVPWALYVAGAALTLWVWAALPLLVQRLPVPVYLLADLAAAAGLLVLIAALTDGWVWLTRLALPILVLTGALGAVLGALIARHGSRLTIGGVFFLLLIVWLLALEALIDLYIAGTYRPGWSVIAAAAGLVAAVFLLIVRLRPRLREEFRRRFHT